MLIKIEEENVVEVVNQVYDLKNKSFVNKRLLVTPKVGLRKSLQPESMGGGKSTRATT